LLVVGVDEERGTRGEKLKVANTSSIPGLKAKDWEAAASNAIRSRTRPGVTPEVASVPIPDDPEGRVLLLVRVEESLEAPHEVHVSSSPEIPVRRADNTEGAGLNDVERLIYRRDRLRGGTGEPLVPDFFEGVLGPDPDYDPQSQGHAPIVGIALRPRRAVGLRFAFSSELDRKIEELSMTSGLTSNRTLRPTSSGVRVRDTREGTPATLVMWGSERKTRKVVVPRPADPGRRPDRIGESLERRRGVGA
jgi:hypothetical protein